MTSKDEQDPKDLFGTFESNPKWYDPSWLMLAGYRMGKGSIRNISFQMDSILPKRDEENTLFYHFENPPIFSRYVGSNKPSYIDSQDVGESILRDMEKLMSQQIETAFGIPPHLFGKEETSTTTAFKQAEPMHKENLMQALKMLEEASKDFLERERGIGKGWICVMPHTVAQLLIQTLRPELINTWTMFDLERITMRRTWIAQTDSGGAEYCDPLWAYARYYPRPYLEPKKPKPYRRGKRDSVLLGQFQL